MELTFKHMGAIRVLGSLVTIKKTSYSASYPGSFLLDNNQFWCTVDGSDPSKILSVGSQLMVLTCDDQFVTVRDNSRSVTVDKEKLLAEAKKSKSAHALLKRLCPEAFAPDPERPDWNNIKQSTMRTLTSSDGKLMLERRGGGKFDGHVLLGSDFVWKIEVDGNVHVLVGTPKK